MKVRSLLCLKFVLVSCCVIEWKVMSNGKLFLSLQPVISCMQSL